jgi:hypothetical protein
MAGRTKGETVGLFDDSIKTTPEDNTGQSTAK